MYSGDPKSERPNTGFNPKPKVQKMIFFYLSQNHLLLHQEMETSVNALSFFHHQLKLNIILFGYLMPPPSPQKTPIETSVFQDKRHSRS